VIAILHPGKLAAEFQIPAPSSGRRIRGRDLEHPPIRAEAEKHLRMKTAADMSWDNGVITACTPECLRQFAKAFSQHGCICDQYVIDASVRAQPLLDYPVEERTIDRVCG
jgi:hypothetical protein